MLALVLLSASSHTKLPIADKFLLKPMIFFFNYSVYGTYAFNNLTTCGIYMIPTYIFMYLVSIFHWLFLEFLIYVFLYIKKYICASKLYQRETFLAVAEHMEHRTSLRFVLSCSVKFHRFTEVIDLLANFTVSTLKWSMLLDESDISLWCGFVSLSSTCIFIKD